MIFLTTNAPDPKLAFKPEVIGRLDGVLEYKQFDQDVMKRLIDKELKTLNKRLSAKNIEISLTDEVYSSIESGGFDPVYGARPLNSYFQKTVVRPLSHMLIKVS